MLAVLLISGLTTMAQVGQAWSAGVPSVLKLVQANVAEDTVVAFIQNSGQQYSLSANEIIMLKQQGATDKELNAMLLNHAAQPAVYAAPQPTPQVTYVQPAVTYVQPAPVVYSDAYYYPYYNTWPVSVSVGWGWNNGWHGGGWNNGWHGGGSWHGGGGWHH